MSETLPVTTWTYHATPLWQLLAILSVLLYSSWTLAVAFRPSLARIPGPVAARFSRLYLFYHATRGDFHTLYRGLHDRYGSLVRVGPNKVSVADPRMIGVIYGVNSGFVKSNFYRSFDVVTQGIYTDNLFTTPSPSRHKSYRAPIAQAYSLSYMRQLEPLINECTQLFTDAMYSLSLSADNKNNQQPIDFGQWLQWYTFDSIGKISFNRLLGFMQNREDSRGTIAALDGFARYSSAVGQLPELHRCLLGNVTLQRFMGSVPALAKMNAFGKTEEMILQMMESCSAVRSEQRGEYLGYLRNVQEKDAGKMSDFDIFGHLTANLAAGSDTTAMALRAIFYFLVKNPRTYEKLMAEIDEAEAEGKFSEYVEFSEGQKLQYLQAVMKEAMRLHPGVGMPLERVVPEGGATLCGEFIPGGTIVGVNAWVVHHSKEVFGFDTDTFRPERWLDAEPDQLRLMEQSSFAFGHGATSCIGKNISILEITKFVPQLLRHFRLEWASPEEEWSICGVWFAKQSGVMMRVIPRKR